MPSAQATSSGGALKLRASVLTLPAVKRLLRDPKLPADLVHSCARLRQSQGKGDLLLAELRLLHRQNLLLEILPEKLTFYMNQFCGRRSLLKMSNVPKRWSNFLFALASPGCIPDCILFFLLGNSKPL